MRAPVLQESTWNPPPSWQGEADTFPVEPGFPPSTARGGEAQRERHRYEAFPAVPHDEEKVIAPNGTDEFHNVSDAAASLTEAEAATAPAHVSTAAMKSIHHTVEPSARSVVRGNGMIDEAVSKTRMGFGNGSTGIGSLEDLTGGGQSDGSRCLEAPLSEDLANCSMEQLSEMSKVSGDTLVLPLSD